MNNKHSKIDSRIAKEHYCITCKENLDIENFYFNKT